MEYEVEYLTEWPPPKDDHCVSRLKDTATEDPPASAANQTTTFPPSKRPKREPQSVQTEQRKSTHNAALTGAGWKKDSLAEAVEDKSEDQKLHLSRDELHLVRSHYSVTADVLLARWWKTKSSSSPPTLSGLSGCDEEGILSAVHSNNGPQSQIYHISRLQKAIKILKCRVHHLESLATSVKASASVEDLSSLHHSIATCHQRLSSGSERGGDLDHILSALKHCKAALEIDPGNREFLWLSKLLERQQDVETSKDLATRRLKDLEGVSVSGSGLRMPTSIQVERRHIDDLTTKEFFEQYAMTHSPVIITGLVERMTSEPWTLDYIKKRIGHKCAPLKRMVSGSLSWAKLEPAGECLVSSFIESLDSSCCRGDKDSQLRYLFDWSLPANCPELAKGLKIPNYFANDFLQRTASESLYRDSWPSLFVAPAGVTSELHVDAFGSNFWMALFEGRKRWLFFPPEDVHLLYPIFSHSTDATFQVDLSSPNLSRHPLLSLTHPRECVLEGGEVLFVPAGCPHRVENLTKSLAISANFVDESNFDLVLRELRINALQDQRADNLLQQLQAAAFNRQMNEFDLMDEDKSSCIKWEQFKLQS